MKKIFIIMAGLLLIGTSAFAQGDLIVNGDLGVGVSTPGAKVDIDQTTSTGNTSAFRTNLTKSSTTYTNANIFSATDNATNTLGFTGMAVNPFHEGTGSDPARGFQGAQYTFQLRGSTTAWGRATAQNNLIWLRGNGDYNITDVVGVKQLLQSGNTAHTNTFTNYYAFYSSNLFTDVGQTVNGTNWRHFYAEDFSGWNGTVANLAGLWIDQQTYGTNNYGIALNGTGAGADITFGNIGVAGQDARIYFDGSEIRAVDAAGNDTAISPHDPETGEWVFYSKNVRTGRTVKINMEKLVKAVEKITGETFMIETFAVTDGK